MFYLHTTDYVAFRIDYLIPSSFIAPRAGRDKLWACA
jgi:hypothetical protein